MLMKNNRAIYKLLVPLILFIFRIIPLRVRKGLFTVLAMIYYHLSPRHRLIALHNLKSSFRGKDMADITAIANRVYRNLAVVSAEFFTIPVLNKDNIAKLVEAVGMENCEKALKKGKGLILYSAHFGNWELAAAALSIFLRPSAAIYRRLDNAFLDELVLKVRASTGNILIPKERAMRQMRRILSNNEIVGIIIDQNMAWQEGVFVDFFHRPACTTDGIAQLAMLTGAPVIPMFLLRLKGEKSRLTLGKEIDVIDTGNWDADVLINTQNLTRVIEDIIRSYPDQWLWVHHRWKTKPWQAEKCS
jgi:KDO2-lipid IV(A) lauroyltransferase